MEQDNDDYEKKDSRWDWLETPALLIGGALMAMGLEECNHIKYQHTACNPEEPGSTAMIKDLRRKTALIVTGCVQLDGNSKDEDGKFLSVSSFYNGVAIQGDEEKVRLIRKDGKAIHEGFFDSAVLHPQGFGVLKEGQWFLMNGEGVKKEIPWPYHIIE